MSEPKKARAGASRRLGSLAGDGDASGSGLGLLRISPGTVVKPEPGTGEAGPSAGPPSAAPARKGKFVPKVPAARRKKVEVAASEVAAGANRAADFQHLIQQAQDEANNKGRGRGRGRGAGRGIPQAFYQGQQQVTLGGVIASGPGEVKSVKPGGGGGGSSFADNKATKMKRDDGDMNMDGLPESAGDDGADGGALDYDQYYPTQLPLRLPEDEEAVMRNMAPAIDEADIVEGPGDVAGALGLTGGDSNERLLLFQLPQLLPAPLSARATSVKLEAGRQQRGGKDDHADRETPPPDQALSMDQLPAGRVGKLLIFKSGAVKLQMGEVLLDVSLGSSCGFRQDLAATNVVAGAAPTGHFLQLGKVESRLVCSPDISQLLNDSPVPNWERITSPAAVGPSHTNGNATNELEDDVTIETLQINAVKMESGMQANSSKARRQMVASDDEDE